MTPKKLPIRPIQNVEPNPPANWPPPRDEWDLRYVTDENCRFVCLTEYPRNVEAIKSDPAGWVFGKDGKNGKGTNTILAYYLIHGGDLSMPWVTMHNIAYKLIAADDLKNPASLAARLNQRANPLYSFLWRNLSAATRKELRTCGQDGEMNQETQAKLVDDLNDILRGICIYDHGRFAGVNLEIQTRVLLDRKPRGDDLFRLNRMLLEDAFPLEISKNRSEPVQWKHLDVWSGSAIRIRPMAEVKRKIKQAIASGKDLANVLDRHLDDNEYVMYADFCYHGIRKVVMDFTSWAPQEARRFPDRPRGRAFRPPYDYLKWLAAYRLEKARRLAGVSFKDVKDMLREEAMGRPDCALTLPIYASQGAWCKATRDAARLLKLLESNPMEFESKILF